MADELGAELSIDFDDARREVDRFARDLEDELERAVRTFGDEYEREVRHLPSIEPDIDTREIPTEIERAIVSADRQLELPIDDQAITSSITEAVEATRPALDIDTSSIGPSLIDAIEDVHPSITPDTDELSRSLIDVIESLHPEITPEIDTTGIKSDVDALSDAFDAASLGGDFFGDSELQAQELADTLSDLTQESESTSDGLGNVSNVSTTLATAFSAARGDGQKLLSDLSQIRGGFGAVVAGTVALTAGFTALFEAGERSLASVERAQVVLGDNAERLERINVGGLTGSLSELAIQAGQSGGKLREAATSAAQVGLSSGKSVPEVTEFANKVNALALRAVALNPALGDAGSVAERLNTVLARGGRFLARYGIDLTSAEITTRALADSGKTAVRDLTLFERSVAGADIAVEKLGNRLGKDFARGAETSTVRIASLRAELNAAFARAGKPLVEPTIDSFEALAEAGAGVSTSLGKLGEAVLPVVATGLETVGTTAGVAAEAFGAIPGEVAAITAALFVFDRTATRAFGGPLRSLSDFRTAGALAMETVAGRSVVALGALTALDQGLKLLGTSTKDLGVEFITTGAAIGFALAGPQGAVGGALLGGIAQAISAEGELAKATREIDEEFQRAESSSGDLRQALFSGADTAVGLASAIANLDANMARFVLDASAFKALNVTGDLRALGLTAQDVARLAQEGDAGFAQFIARAQEAKKISIDLGKVVADSIQIETGGRRNLDEELSKTISKRIQEGGTLRDYPDLVEGVRDKLADLGISARLTAADFVALSGSQQKAVLALLREQGESTKLLVAFQTLQKQIRQAEHDQFDLFVTTNKLSPAIANQAKAAARAAEGHIDWVKALQLVDDAARGALPELGRLTAQTFSLQREFSGLQSALTNAAANIPSVGSALTKALDTSFFEGETLAGLNFLDTDKLLGNLSSSAEDVKSFFEDIRKIADTGASNTAAALLALGPENLGARVAADLAANQTPFREGMEKAFEGIAQGQLFGESVINEMRSRIAFLASTLGTTMEERLKAEFGVVDISQITTPQLIAFIQRYGDGGSAAAKDLVAAFNREIVTRRLAGLDTTELEGAVADVKARITGTLTGITDDVDVAMQAAQAKAAEKAPQAVAPIAQALEDIQPEVLAGLDQIGNIVATGTAKTKDEYDAEFSKLKRITEATLDTVSFTITSRQVAVQSAVSGVAQAAVRGAEWLPDRFEGIGIAAAEGLARGIAFAASAAAHASEAMAASVAQASEGYLVTYSPSRLFMDIGGNVAEGFALGIERGTEKAVRASHAMARSTVFSPAFGSAPVPAGGLSLSSPVVQVDLSGLPMAQGSRDVIVNGGIHNYGPGVDARGAGLIRAFRDYQFAG